jgi:transposase
LEISPTFPGYTPKALAYVLKKPKIAQLLEDIEKKETGQLSNALWMNILEYLTPYYSELQPIPLLSKQLKRLR